MNKSKEFELFARDRNISSLNLHNYKKRVSEFTTPYIVEQSTLNMSTMDVFSRLMVDRIIFLGTGIDDYVANVINAQLLFLEADNNESPIDIYINSPGGEIYSGLAIYDVMNILKVPVNTTVSGLAASMAFVIAISGNKGTRSCLPNSRLMQHQPSSGTWGDATTMSIDNKEVQFLKKNLYTIISEKTGQTYRKVVKDCERDYWMSADEAIEYGAIDRKITRELRNKQK